MLNPLHHFITNKSIGRSLLGPKQRPIRNVELFSKEINIWPPSNEAHSNLLV